MGSCQVLAQSTSPTIRALECNVEGGLGAPIRKRASELEGAAICVSIYLSSPEARRIRWGKAGPPPLLKIGVGSGRLGSPQVGLSEPQAGRWPYA